MINDPTKFIAYHKGVFKIPQIHVIHSLYEATIAHTEYVLDERVKNRIPSNEFIRLYDATTPTVPNDMPSIELLLGDYLADPLSKYRDVTRLAIKDISLNLFIEEMVSLREHIIRALPDLKTLFPDMCFYRYDYDTIKNVVSQDKRLSWLFDKQFTVGNVQYVTNNYDITQIIQTWERFFAVWGIKDDMTEIWTLLQNDQIDQLILRDINRQFGCVYGELSYREVVNTTWLCQVYEWYRTNDDYLYYLRLV